VPPEEPQPNIQDAFLNSARRDRTMVTIVLTSDATLTGRIKNFDRYSVIVEVDAQEQLVFKHAISSVVLPRSVTPGKPATAGKPASE